MNRTTKSVVIGLMLWLPAAESAIAQDLTGTWGLSGIAQAAFPLGQESVKDQARDVGPDFGGMLRYGLSPHWSVGASYENMDLGRGVRVEPIHASVIHSCTPDKQWSPTTLLGLGVGRGVDTKIFNDLTAKAAVGLEYFLVPSFAVGPQIAYHYISDTGTESRRHAHILTAGVLASVFFGGRGSSSPAAAAPAPEPVKAAAAIGISVSPTEASLTPGETQTLQASVTGTANQSVTWSLTPALGNVVNGVYTAPATLALSETVQVTATSVADPSKSASSLIRLTPATAAKAVNIRLDVLFDTGRDTVKPQYDAEIRKVAEFMKSYPSAQAEIEGHTDDVGSAELNADLSQRRADNVRAYLVEKLGVPAGKLSSKGYGESRPMADNKTSEGRAQNRRVVATFTAMERR